MNFRQLLPALAVTASTLALAYWQTFDIWFRADDFAWLGLRDSPSITEALFKPEAQGTIRAFSERLFFLLIGRFFGIESTLPFRLVIFATQIANALLLSLLALKLTGSKAASLAAIPIWLLNPGVAMSMCWISSYNQFLVTFCLLAATLAFLAERPLLCWTAFLLGFGALETNVMLPVLLVAASPRRWRETLPFFGVSLAYACLWFAWIRKVPADPAYQLSFDAALPATLWQYLSLNFGIGSLAIFPPLLAALLALGGRQTLFGIAWFLALIAPVLPLRNHVSDYYLASASIGIALAVAALIGRGKVWAFALACGLLLITGWQARTRAITWYLDVTSQIETVVQGVRELHRQHPASPIVLEAIPRDVIDNALGDRPFRLYGISAVSLEPVRGAVVYRYLPPSSSR